MTYRLPDVFSKNRSEETKEDNWADFVVPPFLDDLEIKSQSKALVIIGGRGCGKTTLLRYFCHAAQFSPRRPELPDNALQHIGLYWRADTNFLNSFFGGEQSSETWRGAFQHLLACELGKEIIRSLQNLNCNQTRQASYGRLDDLDLSPVKNFDETLEPSLAGLKKGLEARRVQLEMWINNLDDHKKPVFLPADNFLRTLIAALREQLPYLSNSTFAVFIDEYENLRDEQQRFINGLLKHGSPPLLYNIAMKRNGWQTRKTIGPESIQDISDYRIVDLEQHLANHFDLFAAELVFFRLVEHGVVSADRLPISVEQLRSADCIRQRYDSDAYRNSVIGAAEVMLPRVAERTAAAQILADAKLRMKLLENIAEALSRKQSSLQPDSFVDDNFPEASVIMPALINRKREDPEKLLVEFAALKSGGSNRLAATSDLISNNLFGCVNAIYLDARRNSILFSGFTALSLIARGNIRHLLELIHRIFKMYGATKGEELPVVPPETQVDAIREASGSILSTVSGHGTYGPQLYALALCLGSIFRERHRNERQSEPEINHFTISSGDIDHKLRAYLDEAEKWSVLFVMPETKMKNTGAISLDYVLNPIYAPYFQISFRKKRSLELSSTQLMRMLEGDQRARDALVRELGRQEASMSGDLFGGGA